jgi:hypothetical protein
VQEDYHWCFPSKGLDLDPMIQDMSNLLTYG